MNVFQKILGMIFPPYKFAALRKEQGQLFTAIITILPENMNLVKITNSEYCLSEFDIFKFRSDNIHRLDFQFRSEKIDLFYDSLDINIKQRIMPSDIFEIEFDGSVYYVFKNLDDGNYLAVNENLEVYSLVHDAKPMAKKHKVSLEEILADLQTNKFDKRQYLNNRY